MVRFDHEVRSISDAAQWAISSKDAGELLPLPNEFRQHILHPYRNPEASGSLLAFSKNRRTPEV